MAITTTGDTISGFNTTDTIDTTDLPYVQGATATYDPSTQVLTVTSGNYYASYTLTNTSVRQFVASNDGKGGTDVRALCFVAGTAITTSRGPVPVEELATGDIVITYDGRSRPIRWIGCRMVDCRSQATPSDHWPIRIRADAFGDGRPKRDLFLSPGHPVLVRAGAEEVLVPVMCLINGTTVAREPRDEVSYWHVELDAHDILLAEGLPAESFIDLGNRAWFATAHPATSLFHPDLISTEAKGRCRRVVTSGPEVEAERARLDRAFTATLVDACGWSDAAATYVVADIAF